MARRQQQTVAEATPSPPTVTRHLDLEPADWFAATWRQLPPLPRPEPKPFVPERPEFSLSMTPEEARFWFAALTTRSQEVKSKELGLYLARQDFTERPTGQEALQKLRKFEGDVPPQIVVPLATLVSAAEFAEFLMDVSQTSRNYPLRGALTIGFRRFLAPYLTAAERDVYRKTVQANLSSVHAPGNLYQIPMSLHLASMLGLHDEILANVSAWPDQACAHLNIQARYHSNLPLPQHVVLGLGSAALVDGHMRRLGLNLVSPDVIRGWLANTEYAGLDLIRDSILLANTKADCEALLPAFCLVNAPEAAPYMLELRHAAKAPGTARQWLDEHPANAIAGLIAPAADRGKVAEAAVEFLRDAKRRGFASLIEAQLAEAEPAVADTVRRLVMEANERIHPALDDTTTPDWLREALAATPTAKAKLPSWARPSSLPPLLLGDHCLSEGQVNAALVALQKSKVSAATPLVQVLAQHVERPLLDAFAWKLFELWQSEGAPSKDKWAFTALGHFGGDASVMKLTPLVKVWPGQSQHARAVTGLECLRRIGTDIALMQLNSIAQKLKFKGLQNKARIFMDQIAGDRGMSRTQLEDRIVPDLDLDERGSRVFDFGPRQFRFVLDADMKPMVRDDAGKLKSDLPKPNSKDDADRSKAAVEAWKLLKKQIKDVVKVQAARLEQAMVSSRRWHVGDFEMLLLRHPLMINLVRRLLWGGYDKSGKLQRGFRVTEEQEYADISDSAMSLDGLCEVGIVHPLHLSDEERAQWGEVFGDYEIIPPFPQLGRRVNRLLPEELMATEITRFNGPKINPMALVGILDKLGWSRGPAQDAGIVHFHTKDFPSAGVFAILEYAKGVPMGYIEGWDEQTLERGYFIPVSAAGGWNRREWALPLGQIDPVVMSEVLGAMAVLASKGT